MIKILFILLLLVLFLFYTKILLNKNENFNECRLYNKVDIPNLKKGQKRMTQLFKYFDNICKKNNLKYWAIGGTLIGAMRHKGWIPWDGDIDVGMMNDDYQKFRNIMKNEIPYNIVFEHKPIKKGCSKLRLLDAHYKYSPFGFHWDDDDGLQLDIFVFKKGKNSIYGNRPILGRPDKKKRNYNDIFPLKILPFEDMKIYVPNKCGEISKKIWGANPPKLLPLKDRYPHEGNIVCDHVTKKMIDKYNLNNRNLNKGIITEHGKVIYF